MANHIRRSGNAWVADFNVNGRRKQLKRRTKAEARDAMALCLTEVETKSPPKTVTLSEARRQTILTRWRELPSLRVNSQTSEEALAYFEDVYLDQITCERVKQWRHLLAKGNKPATVNRKVSCLSAILGNAVESGQLPEMPVMPKRLRMDNVKDRVFSAEEERAFCQTFRLLGYPEYADLLTFLIETGCRFARPDRQSPAMSIRPTARSAF